MLRNVSLAVDMDDRIALLGANGNGKSTLAKLLADRLPALAGEIRRAGRSCASAISLSTRRTSWSRQKTRSDYMMRLAPRHATAGACSARLLRA